MNSKDQLLLNLMNEGNTSISNMLLSHYKLIGLSDQEMMLIIHLLYYQSKGNLFPSITQLEKRMTSTSEEIMKLLQRLVRQGYLYIEESNYESGIISEIYNLQPTFIKLIKELERDIEVTELELEEKEEKNSVKNIFILFEQEFGRPLSPMEIEFINTWLDKDKHTDEVILYALKEAVYSSKLNFRYIDKILFEWQKKNLRSIQQIKDHIQKFRRAQEPRGSEGQDKKGKDSQDDFEFYNWLED